MAARTITVSDRSQLELELALRGFVRAQGEASPQAWNRTVAPQVGVSFAPDGAVLECPGRGRAFVEDAAGEDEVLRIVDDWIALDGPARHETRGPTAPSDDPVVVAVLEDEGEGDLPALAVGSGVIPDEMWRLLSGQFEQVRDLSDRLAAARERAARAEAEVEFLRSRMREIDARAPNAAESPSAAGVRRSGRLGAFLRRSLRPARSA